MYRLLNLYFRICVGRVAFVRPDEYQIWEDQAQRLDNTSELLRGWFKSLRDNHTRLDKKKKSGDGAPELTEREEWIMAKFEFLKTVIDTS